jgi:carbamate kinase
MQILEARVIELLMSQGVTVICAGGGGIHVVERSDGSLIGVEAVIGKDPASALLARQLRADQLLLLTDIDGCGILQTANRGWLSSLCDESVCSRELAAHGAQSEVAKLQGWLPQT